MSFLLSNQQPLKDDSVPDRELLHYYVALEADITENDMVTAQLIDASRKKVKGGLEGFGKGIGWREDHYMVSMNASWQSLGRKI